MLAVASHREIVVRFDKAPYPRPEVGRLDHIDVGAARIEKTGEAEGTAGGPAVDS